MRHHLHPMQDRDRHGRGSRADNDPRRRPSDGFRTADGRRFAALVRQVVAALPTDLRSHLDQAELAVEDVPDPGSGLDRQGAVVLARLDLPAGPRSTPLLTVARRPIELRARNRLDLVDEVARAVRDAVREALGQPPEDD
jgi:hypothetical protein